MAKTRITRTTLAAGTKEATKIWICFSVAAATASTDKTSGRRGKRCVVRVNRDDEALELAMVVGVM